MTTASPIKIIARAKFALGPVCHYTPSVSHESQPENRSGSVINPAEVEYNGIRLLSRVPQSAAEAERINEALDHA